jgi:hypothetical protein
MMVDLAGTTTMLPHFGHLPFLPECFSSTLMSRPQLEQANLIMVCPFPSALTEISHSTPFETLFAFQFCHNTKISLELQLSEGFLRILLLKSPEIGIFALMNHHYPLSFAYLNPCPRLKIKFVCG